MCGIIGIISKQPLIDEVINSLTRLEYRGYDSAGISFINEKQQIETIKAEGKLKNLTKAISKNYSNKTLDNTLKSQIAIGHTRWATHGKPNIINAHPHATKTVSIVHNGIIENHRDIEKFLLQFDIKKQTNTDSEICALLFDYHINNEKLSPEDAFIKTIKMLKGAYAIVAITNLNNKIYSAKLGSPLCFGFNDNNAFIGSDPIAIGSNVTSFCFLEDGDIAIISLDDYNIICANGNNVKRPFKNIALGNIHINKGNHKHFMIKEIYDQPETTLRSLTTGIIDINKNCTLSLADKIDFKEIKSLDIIACGTAFYAGKIANYWFEKLANIPCRSVIASEYRYADFALSKGNYGMVISQSGETADSLAACKKMQNNKTKSIAVVNVKNSSIYRHCDINFLCKAGTEIGVASTKAFTSQLITLASLAINAGYYRGTLSPSTTKKLISSLANIPSLLTESLSIKKQVQEITGDTLEKAQSIFFIGRGIHYPLACEGALKLKEISYIHAEGYAAGELKHGPLALIDENFPVIVIAPHDKWFTKTASNMEEIISRGGTCILLTDKIGKDKIGHLAKHVITLPSIDCDEFLPIIYSIPIQLLAYFTALGKGTDIDQPRNLAKSVTVE